MVGATLTDPASTRCNRDPHHDALSRVPRTFSVYDRNSRFTIPLLIRLKSRLAMNGSQEHAIKAEQSNANVGEPNWGRALLGFVLSTTATCMLLVLLQGV